MACSEELGPGGVTLVHGAPEEPCAVNDNLALPSLPTVPVHVNGYISCNALSMGPNRET